MLRALHEVRLLHKGAWKAEGAGTRTAWHVQSLPRAGPEEAALLRHMPDGTAPADVAGLANAATPGDQRGMPLPSPRTG